MTKVLWAAFRRSTALVGTSLAIASSVVAAEPSAEAPSINGDAAVTDPFKSISQPFNSDTQQPLAAVPTQLAIPYGITSSQGAGARSLHAAAGTTKKATLAQQLNATSPARALSDSSATVKKTTLTPLSAQNSPLLSLPPSPPILSQQNAGEMPTFACNSDPSTLETDLSSTETEEASNCLDRVTSVSQLSDVQPTDWAFQALQSLVERYGIIAGYPDGTFRGNRAMSRYEFAAALNAALETIDRLIATDPANLALKEDLATLERLSAEFGAELATLRGRVDSLEARASALENSQFSTTTKMNAIISFHMSAARAGGDVKVERIDPEDIFSAAERGANGKPIVSTVKDDPSITFSQVVGLFLTTSFTGNDLLVTTLVAGNGTAPANLYTSAGWFNTFGTSGLDITPTVVANDLGLIEAYYFLPLSKSLQVAVGPKMLWVRFFDTNAFTSNTGLGASSFNTYGSTLINDPLRGGGAVVLWRLSEKFDLRLGYVAVPDPSDPTKGLFDGTNVFTTQLTYSPRRNINIRLLYERSRLDPVAGQIKSRPIIGVADDGLGGDLEDATANSFGINFDWLLTPRLGVFGRYSYANTHLEPATDGVSDGNIKAQSLQLGVAFPDLGKKGAIATLSYVLPFSILEGRRFLVAGGGDGGVEYDIEAAYYFPIADNIAIIPTYNFIGNANNFSDNPNIHTGTVRMQFSF